MSSSAAVSPDHHHEKLRYVLCVCDTVLAVSVPSSSLFKTVTVRCGQCRNLLSVDMRGLLFPASAAAVAANQLHRGHNFFSPQTLMEAMRNAPANLFSNHQNPNEPPLLFKRMSFPSLQWQTNLQRAMTTTAHSQRMRGHQRSKTIRNERRSRD